MILNYRQAPRKTESITGIIATVCLGWSDYDDTIYNWLRESGECALDILYGISDVPCDSPVDGYDYAHIIPWFVMHGCDIRAIDDSEEAGCNIESGFHIVSARSVDELVRFFDDSIFDYLARRDREEAEE